MTLLLLNSGRGGVLLSGGAAGVTTLRINKRRSSVVTLLNNQKPRRCRRGFWEKEKEDRLLLAAPRVLVPQLFHQTPRLDFGRSPADRLAAVLDRVVARLAVEDDFEIITGVNNDFARWARCGG